MRPTWRGCSGAMLWPRGRRRSRRVSREGFLPRSKPRARAAASISSRAAPNGRTSIRRRRRTRSTCSTSRTGSIVPLSSARSTSTSPIGERSAPARCRRPTTPRMRSASSVRWCASGGARRRSSCCVSSCRTAGHCPGINGRRSPGATARPPRTWAICRTPGFPPNTCLPCAVYSPTSSSRRRSLVLAAGVAQEWIEGAGVEVRAMPTLYGPLSYSLRRIDARTLRFDIDQIDAPLILRPPHREALRSVLVNGSAVVPSADDSIVVAQTPAQVICVSS